METGSPLTHAYGTPPPSAKSAVPSCRSPASGQRRSRGKGLGRTTVSSPAPRSRQFPVVGGTGFGVLLHCGRGAQVLLVEAGRDQRAQQAHGGGQGDVEDQPAGDL